MLSTEERGWLKELEVEFIAAGTISNDVDGEIRRAPLKIGHLVSAVF